MLGGKPAGEQRADGNLLPLPGSLRGGGRNVLAGEGKQFAPAGRATPNMPTGMLMVRAMIRLNRNVPAHGACMACRPQRMRAAL